MSKISRSGFEIFKANSLLALGVFFWAMGFPAAEVMLEIWTPLPVITARLALATLILLSVWVFVEGLNAVFNAPWIKAIWIGICGLGFSGYLFIKAQALTDPVTVAVASASLPAFAAVLEVIFDNRRLRLTFLIGVLLAIIGGVIAVGFGKTEGESSPLIGGSLVCLASFSYAWGTRASVKNLPNLSALARTTATIVGAILFLGSLLIFGITLDLQTVTLDIFSPRYIKALVIHALFGIAISQWLYLNGVSKVGVAVASVHVNAAPFYVMLVVVILGGEWSWVSLLGALIIGVGVFLANIK
jgi:drug/metabolite transporter (DMT)-like permease